MCQCWDTGGQPGDPLAVHLLVWGDMDRALRVCSSAALGLLAALLPFLGPRKHDMLSPPASPRKPERECDLVLVCPLFSDPCASAGPSLTVHPHAHWSSL